MRVTVQQPFHRCVARAERIAVAQGVMQPVAQQPAAHVAGAGIEQRQQRGRRLAAQRFGELEIAARGGIHSQVLAAALGAHRGHVRKRLSLRLLRIAEQGAAGADRGAEVCAAIAVEAGRAELGKQRLAAGVDLEIPIGQAGDRVAAEFRRFRERIGDQDFGRADAPREVSVMSSSRAAFSASSWNSS